jgi:hypothetical protein
MTSCIPNFRTHDRNSDQWEEGLKSYFVTMVWNGQILIGTMRQCFFSYLAFYQMVSISVELKVIPLFMDQSMYLLNLSLHSNGRGMEYIALPVSI